MQSIVFLFSTGTTQTPDQGSGGGTGNSFGGENARVVESHVLVQGTSHRFYKKEPGLAVALENPMGVLAA